MRMSWSSIRWPKGWGLTDLFEEDWGRYVLAFVYSHLLERPSIWRLEEWFQTTEIPEVLGLKDISKENIRNVLRARMCLISGLKRTKGLQRRYLERLPKEDIYRSSCRVKLKNTA